MTTTFTPGPYKVRRWVAGCAYQLQAGSRIVADVSDRAGLGEANATFLASAPDMFAALETVRDAYQSMFDVMPVAWQTVDDIVTAAIAKAKGE